MVVIRGILTVAFAWSLFKTISVLVRPDSMDLIILSKAGYGWCFWLLVPTIALGLACALVFLWRPTNFLYRVAQVAIVLDVVVTIFASSIAAVVPRLGKEAYVASRQARGLPIRQEVLQMMDQPVSQLLPVGIAVALASLWLYLLYVFKNKSESKTSSQAPVA